MHLFKVKYQINTEECYTTAPGGAPPNEPTGASGPGALSVNEAAHPLGPGTSAVAELATEGAPAMNSMQGTYSALFNPEDLIVLDLLVSMYRSLAARTYEELELDAMLHSYGQYSIVNSLISHGVQVLMLNFPFYAILRSCFVDLKPSATGCPSGSSGGVWFYSEPGGGARIVR